MVPALVTGMWRRILVTGCIVLAGIVAACSGGSDKPAVDAYFSTCGHPGDQGNELGIGKFCGSLSDCNTTQAAPLCSSLGDDTTHFCTKTCQDPAMGGSAGQCGTATECVCNGGGQCGCTPSVCLQ
jgi:hypothetical protein